jgi:endo-1,4-beta-xylanase
MGKKPKKKQKPTIFGSVFFVVAVFVVFTWALYPHTPTLPDPPLKDLAAKHNVLLGNYASLRRLRDKPYTNILSSQYEFVTIDGEPNWAFNDGTLRPSPTKYNYTNIDRVMAFAKAHSMPVQIHHLVWGEDKWLPIWLKNGNYNKDQLLNIIHDHINNVAGHYRGQVREWTVVNEAFTRGQGVNGLHDWWADHTGDQTYIDDSFIWAHQADPGAKLILNDFNDEEENSVSDAMYNYIKSAKARGVPIDAIGMQMHINAVNPPKKENVIKNMQRFNAIGVKTYVTEFDVNLNEVKGDDSYRNKLQSQIYYDMARACIESGSCPSFAQLGLTDKETWYNDLGWTKSQPLMFDNKYHIKPAFYSFRDAWEQN